MKLHRLYFDNRLIGAEVTQGVLRELVILFVQSASARERAQPRGLDVTTLTSTEDNDH